MEKTEQEDFINNYSRALLTFNLLLRNVNDCIREGDGARLMECYKFALLYFRCYGHTKYAYTLIKLFYKIKFQPETAFRVIWNRFINIHGKKGKNISRDLHLEHLNNFLKELLRSLRSNLNEANAKRIANSVKNLKLIVSNLEESYKIKSKSHSSKQHKSVSDIKKLSAELIKAEVFESKPGRQYESFQNFDKDLLSSLDLTSTLNWMKEKRNEFKNLFNEEESYPEPSELIDM